MSKLTEKEARFVEEYLIDLNTERAALAAGYSASMAKSKAYQWVRNGKVKPRVYEAIQKAIKSRSEKTGITSEWVVLELAKLASADIRNAYNADGTIKPIPEMDAITAGAIVAFDAAEINAGDDTAVVVKKVKLTERRQILELLGRHTGAFLPKGHAEVDLELKRVALEKAKLELEAMRKGGGDRTAELLGELIGRLPG